MNHNPYECNKVPPTSQCKCCGQLSTLAGLVDFSKSCIDAQSGKKIDHWQNQDFAKFIYNDDYVRHDPEYLGARPQGNATLILNNMGSLKDQIDVLDYGAGLGIMTEILGENGFRSAVSFDPYSSAQRPDRQFNMVTCFEVFEHVPDPVALLKDINGFLSADGALLFSTLYCPQQFVDEGLHNWWYCSPRNGHISFYTPAALTTLAAGFDLQLHSFNDSLHTLYRPVVADWLKPFLPVSQAA